jgi:hypothetical protein
MSSARRTFRPEVSAAGLINWWYTKSYSALNGIITKHKLDELAKTEALPSILNVFSKVSFSRGSKASGRSSRIRVASWVSAYLCMS